MVTLDSILPKVTKPARYTGGEWNSIVKDWDSAGVRIALAYPDLYEIGMSNLGLAIIYDLLNQQPNVLAERFYAPWVDMEAEMRRAAIPLFSLESKRPVKDFDIIGFSLGYELTYTNVLNMLDLAQIPVLAAERTGLYPLVIAGGGCALNPEPMADFIDLFVIGEGEEVLGELVEVFAHWKSELGGRVAGREQKRELLLRCAQIKGIYVPSLYQVDYHPDGQVASIAPKVPEASLVIQRRIVAKLPPLLTRPVVPYIQVVHDRGAVEIQRGCTRSCRFCQAGVIYRPVREHAHQEVLAAVDGLVKNCGYQEVSLLSLSSSDYAGIENLVAALCERYRGQKLTLSLPSLRLDSFSVRLADSISERKKGGFTFAPEAGTERLRRVINKTISDEELLGTIETACATGWTNLKLYFMVGLPTETDEDIAGIIELARKILRIRGRPQGKQLQLKINASAFVPKSHTPFQWVAQGTEQELTCKHQRLKLGLRGIGVHLSWQTPQMSLLEGILARGDRRLGQVIHRAWQAGALFDAWSEHLNYEKWLQAFSESGLDPHFYAHRERSLDEILPWSHIDTGVRLAFLKREYQRTKAGQETEDCRHAPCASCGLERWLESCQRRQAASTSSG